MKKAILLIIDGLGDLPTPKTPLQAAKKPNFDKLAQKGITGLMTPITPFVVPGSDTSHLNILGYDPKTYYIGRGPFEALGLGIKLEHGDVSFRANFATANGDKVIDRRAGRIDTQTAAKLAKELESIKKIEDIEVIFKSSVEHRGVLILRGKGLSTDITSTDPHDELVEICKPTSTTKEAEKTARIVNEFIKQSRQKLETAASNKNRDKPANIILVRGAGQFKVVPKFEERFGLRAICVAGGALYKGTSRYVGIEVAEVPGATGDKHTNLKNKADAVVNSLNEGYDFVFLHIKACDSAGHDGDFKTKKEMLEKIDKILPILEKTGAYIVITGDHSTPCARKAHSGHEVPILVYGDQERIDEVKKFDEISCENGGLGHMRGEDVIPLILNLIEKAEKYGS